MASRVKEKRVRRDTPEAQMELRNAAVEAALSLYRERGLAGLTMRAVADSVGVTPMALYRYFANKSELLRVLGEIAMGELFARIRDTSAAAATPRERIEASTRTFVDFWESNPGHYRLVYTETDHTDRPLSTPRLADSTVYKDLLDQAREHLNEFADSLGASRKNVALARDLRLAMMLGYLQASMVIKRYPWRDLPALRERIVQTAVSATADCLLAGGD
ncbi:TetR/AcrR family transcriptional regulator [Sphaerotilaceae bacterium SBD11-9]